MNVIDFFKSIPQVDVNVGPFNIRYPINFSESEVGNSKKPSDVHMEFGNHTIGLQLKDLALNKVLQYQ